MRSYQAELFTDGVLATQVLARKSSRSAVFIPALLVFLALVAEVWVRISTVSVSYALEQARTEALKNDAQLRGLRMELATRTAPQSLSTAATKLGLRATPPQRIRRIEIESSEGVE